MASEDLLKKAVAAFNALSPEQQAEMLEEQRQSWVRGNVGLSRDERGMTSPVMPRPAPAATDTGLETVGEVSTVRESIAAFAGHMLSRQLKPGDLLCRRSQAEELLAAKDEQLREINELLDAGQGDDDGAQILPDFEDGMSVLGKVEACLALLEDRRDTIEGFEADNAAKDARIKELDRCHEGTIDLCNQKTAQIEALEAKIAAAEKALEPFAKAALGYDDPDENGPWPDIQDVFVTLGDCRRARAVLGGQAMTFDNYSRDGAICPHCNNLNRPEDDNYSLYSEDTCEWTCGHCGEEFRVSVYVSHSWTTDPLESDE